MSIIRIDAAGYTYEDRTRAECSDCGTVGDMLDMYTYDGVSGIYCEECNDAHTQEHWHVSASAPGCLPDTWEGPFETMDDAAAYRDELAAEYYGENTIVISDSPTYTYATVSVYRDSEHARRGIPYRIELVPCNEPFCILHERD